MVEIAGDHVGAAADHRGQRLRAALEVDEFDLDAAFLYSPSSSARVVGR